MTGPPSQQVEPTQAPDSFLSWLRDIPVIFPIITVSVGAALGLFAPEVLLPTPLQPLRPVATLIVLVAFLLAWTWRHWLRAHPRSVGATTLLFLILFSVQRLLFVRAVEYTEPAPETRHFVVGIKVTDPDLAGMTDEDVIKAVGGTWSSLRSAWGTSFVIVAIAYSLTYLLLVQAVIMSIGSTALGQPRTEPVQGANQ